MTSPHRTPARLLARATTLACALLLALPARAATQEDEEPRGFCSAGRPRSACEMVLVPQLSDDRRIVPSGDLADPVEREVNPDTAQAPRRLCLFGRPLPTCANFLVATLNYFPGSDGSDLEPTNFDLVEWEMGWMTNRDPRSADGWAVAAGGSDAGFHFSGKRRYRRWLGRGLALDAGAGLMIAQYPPQTDSESNVVGPTADVTLGLTGWAALSARGHVLVGKETSSRVDLGVRLGTVPSLIGGILGTLLAVAAGVNSA